MIDMGGGYGRFAMNVAKKYRNIHTTILDLPEVCEEARRKIADEGLSDRVCIRAGSFFDPIFNCEADL